MKIKDIQKEASNIINTVFIWLKKNDNKEARIKAISFIDTKIKTLENWDRWEAMFIWRNVKQKVTNLFGKKFIS